MFLHRRYVFDKLSDNFDSPETEEEGGEKRHNNSTRKPENGLIESETY